MLPPLVALAWQWTFWSYIQPYAWLCFYPAVFLSSWIGGLRGGLAATFLSTGLVIFFFIPPEYSFALANPRALAPISVFLGMGMLFSFFQNRLRKVNRLAVESLASAMTANDQLETRVRERTAELERMNRSLRESEELFSKAFQLSPDCMTIVRHSDRTVLKANEALCRLWGSAPDEVIGKQTLDYTNWVSDAEQSTFMQKLQAEGECLGFETMLRLGDRRLVPFSLSSRAITLNGEACVLTVMHDIMERRRAEAASLAITAIVESSDDAIIGKDLDSIITSWNPAAEKIFGYTAGEMLGTPVLRIIPPERQAEEATILAQITRGEPVRHFETVRVKKNGQPVDVSVTISPIKDSAGRVMGASKIARDITESKRVERKLIESEVRYRSLFDHMVEGYAYCRMIFLDGRPRDFIYLTVNPAFERLTGLRDVVGKNVSVVIPGIREADPELFAAYGRVAQTGRPERFEIFVKALDMWFSISVYQPEAGCFVAVFDVITERKRAEAALRESEERFRTMANSMSQLAWIARADGFIHWYNQRWYDYTGTTPEQMEGWGWQSVHDPAVLPKVMENWQGAIAAGQPFEMEFPLRRADGQFRAFLTRGQPLKNANGEVVQWFGTNTDVETLKQAEEEIRQLNTGLEQRVRERTAQLETANKELEAFAYSVSHDLRAPLRSIDGFSRILLEDCAAKLDAGDLGNLNRVRAAAQRMGLLIDDLLQLSRVMRDGMSREQVDLSAVAGAVIAELRQSEPDRSVECQVPAGILAEGDPHLLRVVLENLLGNAWKFTGRRQHARIEFGAVRRDGRTDYFVRDNGAGFDAAYAAKLFGAFQRLHSNAEFPGTGIGLATVQRIVHRHGGRVWAEGAVNLGATFHFNLNPSA